MYNARITRQNPTGFIILIDQSGSMSEEITIREYKTTKADAVSYATNLLLSELIFRSKRDEGVNDYFDIAVIGYRGNEAKSLINGSDSFVKPSQLIAMNPRQKQITMERVLPNGDISFSTTKQPYWIEAEAEGSTPMYSALSHTYELANKWCKKDKNRASYPLTIFNITDGEATDASDESLNEIATKIKNLKTEDGNIILINIHISNTELHNPSIFPTSYSQLPDNKYAKLLFDMASVMPQIYNESICEITKGETNPPYRGMSYNTSINELISMMNIGSISVNLIE